MSKEKLTKWPEVRSLFTAFADRFVAADRHEIASAIADDFARKVDDLYVSGQPIPRKGNP